MPTAVKRQRLGTTSYARTTRKSHEKCKVGEAGHNADAPNGDEANIILSSLTNMTLLELAELSYVERNRAWSGRTKAQPEREGTHFALSPNVLPRA